MPFLPPANEVWGKVIFLHLFVILFTGGACVVAPGGRGAWLLGGACMVAPGKGACVVAPGGCAWLVPGLRGCVCGCSGGACVVAVGGACVVALGGGMHGCSGGCMVALGGCMVALGGCVWLLRRGMHGCSRGHVWLLRGGRVWDMTRYGDRINERAVRILLECILVEYFPLRKLKIFATLQTEL